MAFELATVVAPLTADEYGRGTGNPPTLGAATEGIGATGAAGAATGAGARGGTCLPIPGGGPGRFLLGVKPGAILLLFKGWFK